MTQDGAESGNAADSEYPVAAFTLRPAKAQDAEPMRRLACAAYQRYVSRIGQEPAPMRRDYASVVARADAWLAERAGELLGFVVCERAVDHLLVESIAVAPKWQGLGIGGALLGLAERRARAAGLSQIRLYTNEAMTENLAYYPRHGYRETHRGIEDGYRRVYFTKVIDLADEDHSRARERIPVTGEGRSGLPAGVVVGEDDPGGVQPL